MDFLVHPTSAEAEVLRYLERFPQAAGGIDDNARWWIARQRLEDTLLQVEQAIQRLVARGLVEDFRVGDRWVRYRRHTDAAHSPTPTASAARDNGGAD